MTNTQIYWFIVCIFGLLFARYSAISNCVRDWIRILLNQPTVDEAAEADRKRGVDGDLHHHIGLANENQNLRDFILPPLFHFKNGFAFFGGLLFILSGFFWTRWFWPLIALPTFVFILPRVFMPLVGGRSHGYKPRLLQGLEIKITAAKRFDTPKEVQIFSDLRDEIQQTNWRQ